MKTKMLVVAVAALHLAACTTLTTAQYGETGQGAGSVRVGDRVLIAMTDSRSIKIDVTRVNEQEICGKDECVAAERIRWVQREDTDVVRTVAAIALVAALVALVAAVHGGAGYPGFPPAF